MAQSNCTASHHYCGSVRATKPKEDCDGATRVQRRKTIYSRAETDSRTSNERYTSAGRRRSNLTMYGTVSNILKFVKAAIRAFLGKPCGRNMHQGILNADPAIWMVDWDGLYGVSFTLWSVPAFPNGSSLNSINQYSMKQMNIDTTVWIRSKIYSSVWYRLLKIDMTAHLNSLHQDPCRANNCSKSATLHSSLPL